MTLPEGPLPGAITSQIETRLRALYRIAWEQVGARGKESRDVRAWDLARGLFRRENEDPAVRTMINSIANGIEDGAHERVLNQRGSEGK